MLYTCLKPANNSFYVHIHLDEKQKLCKMYYYMGFWKGEKSKTGICQRWSQKIRSLPLKHKKKLRKGLKVGLNTVKHKGRALIHSSTFSNLFGFSLKPVCYLPVKIDASVNVEQKIIEITCYIKFSAMQKLVDKFQQLPIFTNNPDSEYVRNKLQFFDPLSIAMYHHHQTTDTIQQQQQVHREEADFTLDKHPNPHDQFIGLTSDIN